MKLRVGWDTTYRYSEPIRLLHTELRVVPTERFDQQVNGARLSVEPRARVAAQTDAFGNTVHHFDILGTVGQVHIALEAEVETAGGPVEADLTPFEQHILLMPTARCPFDPRVEEFARAAGTTGNAVEAAGLLMAQFEHRFTFQVGHSAVEDTAIHLLETGAGVCQDFAHLMLAALRMRGFHARYVSGYLAEQGGPSYSDASHAWLQVWSQGAWHGFDPANRQPQDGRYVVTAVGRDYDDVPPVRGSYRGTATEEWHASVRIAS